MKYRLGLPSIALLLPIIPPLALMTIHTKVKVHAHDTIKVSTYLCCFGSLAGLILGDFVESVLTALLPLAECSSILRNAHHYFSRLLKILNKGPSINFLLDK